MHDMNSCFLTSRLNTLIETKCCDMTSPVCLVYIGSKSEFFDQLKEQGLDLSQNTHTDNFDIKFVENINQLFVTLNEMGSQSVLTNCVNCQEVDGLNSSTVDVSEYVRCENFTGTPSLNSATTPPTDGQIIVYGIFRYLSSGQELTAHRLNNIFIKLLTLNSNLICSDDVDITEMIPTVECGPQTSPRISLRRLLQHWFTIVS